MKGDHFTGLIKIESDSWTRVAVRAMASGIQNLLFTDIRTAEDAKEVVRAVRPETPESGGLHGFSGGRSVGISIGTPQSEVVQSYQDAVIILMIEKKQAIENLESILAVSGIDMIQFGPSDYSMSVGLAGQRSHPAIVEARTYANKTALKMGIQPRAEINDASEAQYYLDLGVRHFCIGTDVSTLFNWFRTQGGAMREIFAKL